MRCLLAACVLLLGCPLLVAPASAQEPHWAASWAGSAQGPYPAGYTSAQPDLRFALPQPEAHDQSFRLIIRPDLWGKQARLRFSNAFGDRPVTLDGVFAGLQMDGAAVVRGSNRPVLFGGQPSVVLPPGGETWSDPVALSFVRDPLGTDIAGRKLAVSFHVVGESGPMTWHAAAMTTSYLSPPGSGSGGAVEGGGAFPFSSTSWYFLDALQVTAPPNTRVVAALGDSITDGMDSTLNGDDRWPDMLSRRIHALRGATASVVNAGLGGNRVTGPERYDPARPSSGGPSAGDRLERDVLSLPGVSEVIWLEGINDIRDPEHRTADQVEAGMREVVRRLRERLPGVRVLGATLPSALGSTSAGHGSADQDAQRKALNGFIRHGGLFDAVVDFDAVTLDPATGGLKPEFVPDSTAGGPGDGLHPNRAGYLAMGQAVDLDALLPPPQPPR